MMNGGFLLVLHLPRLLPIKSKHYHLITKILHATNLFS